MFKQNDPLTESAEKKLEILLLLTNSSEQSSPARSFL